MFSVKDSVPKSLRSRVVYEFTCALCYACSISETTRRICTRVREHLVSEKPSHVYKRLQSSGTCRDSCSSDSFTILVSAASSFQVKIKEALYIKWEIPTALRFVSFLIIFHVLFMLFNFLILFQVLLTPPQPLFPMYCNIQIVNVNFMA